MLNWGRLHLLLFFLAIPAGSVFAQASGGVAPTADASEGNTARVRIDRFEVKGNTLLDPALIARVLAPFKGPDRGYSDIQRALEALEGEYRKAGYSAVTVTTPEQEVTSGTVTFQVNEARVAKVVIKGNQYYDAENIRRALPALVEGATPSAPQLSKNIRLANENPTRQMDVALAVGDDENTVDAEVKVRDSSPHKVFMTLDNTGTETTGLYRMGFNYQNNNAFNRDQAMTLNYTTAPGHVSDVTVLSGSYRIPLYTLGDSIDLTAAHSNVNVIGTTPTVSGPMLVSNGNTYSLHYNHYLPRQGEYTSKIIGGIDYRINGCVMNITSPGAACTAPAGPVTEHPLSLAYNGNLAKTATVTDYTLTVVHNLPGGQHGGGDDFVNAVGASANPDYTLERFTGSVAGALPRDFQYRVAGNAQYTHDIIPPSESFGLVGASAVRGFIERELNSDKGYVLNLEAYTPEMAPKFGMAGSLRFLAFLDHADGWSGMDYISGTPSSGNHTSATSIGAGFRLNYGTHWTAKLDLGYVTELSTETPVDTKVGDRRGMFSMMADW